MARKTADDRKAEIVATALRLADELGPDRMTIQAVADAVGLTQPAIFRHFPTKQTLWQAVAEAITERMTAAWEGVLAKKNEPDQQLVALVLVQFQQIEANPAIPSILHSRELQTENADLRQCFRVLMTRFQGLLQAELTRARDTGRVRSDLVPEDAAVLLVSLIQGMALRWSLGDRSFPLATEGARLLDSQMKLFRAYHDGERRS
ncbi:Transcriptional regulator (plasmid) [Marinovum algicola DG 898]|mgnify:FL=1|nr:Transcriptional regulator [Marinovum algicola DG 898]